MTELTLSSAMSMQKSLQTRLSQLNELKTSVATREIWHRAEGDKVNEPQYDVKKVDKKIVEITKALFKIDQEVKATNARTKIEVSVDYDTLMEEIQ